MNSPALKQATLQLRSKGLRKYAITHRLTIGERIKKNEELYIHRIPADNKNYTISDMNKTWNINEAIPSLLSNGSIKYGDSLVTPDRLEYSRLLNNLLTSGSKECKLDNSEDYEQLFKAFLNYKNAVTDQDFTPLHTYDFNLICEFFLKHKQLKKAQIVLNFLLSKSIPFDFKLVRNYLRLRCGSDVKSWSRNSKKESGNYKTFDNRMILRVIEKSLREKIGFWNEDIIHALGYSKNRELLSNYIFKVWGVSINNLESNVRFEPSENLYPTSQILSAVYKSYCSIDNNNVGALQILDKFLQRYPKVKLDRSFWVTLIGSDNRIGYPLLNDWLLMKKWYSDLDKKPPFDEKILDTLLNHFKETNNVVGMIDVVENCLFHLFRKDHIKPSEMGLLIRYQKSILRRLANKEYIQKGDDFIQQWGINTANKQALESFFRTLIEKRRTNRQKRKAALYSTMKQEDDEDADFIIGRLW